MPTHVALLRGINVGGRNRVAMADLREVVLGLGHTEVATYIQSGNVVFTSEKADNPFPDEPNPRWVQVLQAVEAFLATIQPTAAQAVFVAENR
jgi:uncharacterized protein DUF1697